MTFDELIHAVENSIPSDWKTLEYPTVYGWSWGEKRINDSTLQYLEPVNHSYLSVLKRDVDISLAFGATLVDNFYQSWLESFPNQSASSVHIDLRYRGSVIHRWAAVFVDGGRHLMPLPEPDGKGGWTIRRENLPLAELIFGLNPIECDTLDSCLECCEIAVSQ